MLSTLYKNINYDSKFDVLYYKIGETQNSYGDEIDGHIVLMRDMCTDEIKGVTILDFLKMFNSGSSINDELAKYCDPSAIEQFARDYHQ